MIIVIIAIIVIAFFIIKKKRNDASRQEPETYSDYEHEFHRNDDSHQEAEAYAENLGQKGEMAVSKILSSLPKGYIVINDLLIPTRRGTSQIDHIVISQSGIFVIETKNYSGVIYGSQDSEKWTKYYQGRSYEFYNPIRQNSAHISALARILNIGQHVFIPIIVFTTRADLNIDQNISGAIVTFTDRLKNKILDFSDILLPEQEIENIAAKIRKANITDDSARQNHREWARQAAKNSEKKIERGICPRCGGILVNRKSKYGAFIGCSNYPQCKFKTN